MTRSSVRIVQLIRAATPRWLLAALLVAAAGGIVAQDHVIAEDNIALPLRQPNALRIELVEPFQVRTTRVNRQAPAATNAETQPPGVASEGLPAATAAPRSDEGVDLSFKPIGELKIDIRPKSENEFASLPTNYARDYFAGQPQIRYGAAVYHEEFVVPCRRLASDFSYGPVYFEDKNLERHGTNIGRLQPLASAAHFLVRVPAFPYLTAAQPPWRDYYTSDPYIAGKPAPRVSDWPPLNLRAASWEAGIAVGLILLVP